MKTESPPTQLLGALFDAQAQIRPVPKASEMDAGKFGYMYASAADVVRYARAELSKHGLMVVLNQTACQQFEGARGVVTISGQLVHRPSFESMPVSFSLPYIGTKGRPDDKASQAAVATAEARAFRLLLGLTTSDNEDEVANGSEGLHEPAAPIAQPVRAPKPAAEVAPPPPVSAGNAAVRAMAKRGAEEAKAERKAIQEVEAEEQAEAEAATPDGASATQEEIERFTESARRLGLDTDTAATFASRTPAGAKLKDNPTATFFNFSDASDRGALGQLADVLDAQIAGFKSKKVNPKRLTNAAGVTWPNVVKTWAANQINY